MYYGLKKYNRVISIEINTVNVCNLIFRGPSFNSPLLHPPLSVHLLARTDRGPSNTASASAPGEALIKVLLWGTVAMAMLVLSTDRSLPWRNESLGKIGSSQDR